MLNPSHMTQ